MKNRGIIYFCFLLSFLLFPNLVLASTSKQICVEGNIYEITNIGSKVTDKDLYSITKIEQVERQTILPSNNQGTSHQYPATETYVNCGRWYLPWGSHYGHKCENCGHLVANAEYASEKGNEGEYCDRHYGEYHQVPTYSCPNGGTLNGKTCVVSDILTNEQLADFSFKANNLGRQCTITHSNGSGYTFTSCPTDAQAFTNDGAFSVDKLGQLITNSGGMKIDSNGSPYLQLSDTEGFDGKLVIRVTTPDRENIENYSLEYALSRGLIRRSELNYLTKDQSIKLYFQPGDKNLLEFYITTGNGIECGGAYLGYTEFTIPDYLEIDNPWPSTKICKDFKSTTYNHISHRDVLVPECYDEKIPFKNSITEASIREKINKIIELFKITTTSSDYNLKCSLDATKNKRSYSTSYTLTAGNGYWAASCTETLTVSYELPQKIVAGGGFAYDTNVEIVRQCTPVELRKVPELPKCTYAITSWGGPYNHTGEPPAGPSEEFDNCVFSCDGGKYSQKCINSCYQKVYEKETEEKLANIYGHVFAKDQTIDTLASVTGSLKATPMAAIPCDTPLTPQGFICVGKYHYMSGNCRPLEPGEPKDTENCISDKGTSFRYSDKCWNGGVNHAWSYEYYTSDPNCSENGGPDPNEQAKYDSDYDAIISKIIDYEQQEFAEMIIIDNSSDKGTIINNSKSGMVQVLGGVQNYGTSFYKQSGNVYEVSKSYTIKLPQAYLSLLDNSVRYVEQGKSILGSEYDGGNKYYTDVNSKIVNSWTTSNWTTGYQPDIWNIHVTIGNLGTLIANDDYTWNEIKIGCFYGLINKYICTDPCDPECGEVDEKVCHDPDPDPDPPCSEGDSECPPTSTPTPTPVPPCPTGDICTGGVKYMFREVDLNDLFPDREPRWNWSYEATIDKFGYYSNPKQAIKDIEALGNDAYNMENMEYEIVLTRQNIRSIKKRNKELDNYLNYDLGNCSLFNGKKFCESGLLTNTNYVSSFTKVNGYGQSK